METKTFPAEGISRVIIEQARDCKVSGTPEAAAITVFCEGREAADLVAEGDTLRLRSGVASRVALPPEIALSIIDAVGDLRVAQLAGPVELGAVHGDLRLDALAGPVDVGYADGDVRVDDVAGLTVKEACHGDVRAQRVSALDLASVAGDVHAQQIGGVRLGAVQGDLLAEQVGGALSVEHAAGDVRLTQVGEIRLGAVGGDLSVERVGGALAVELVGGDARVNEVGGRVTLDAVNGDLRASGMAGGLAAPAVAGDAALRGPFTEENEYALEASGDVAVSLPVEADLRLSVRAAGRVRSDVQLTPAPDGSPAFTATLGRGLARLTLRSGGDLRVAQKGAREAGPEGADWQEWKERLHQEVRASVEANMNELNGLGERIRQQVMASLSSAGIDVETGQVRFEYGRGKPGRPPRSAPPERPAPPERQAASRMPAPPERSRGPAGASGQPEPQRASPAEQLAILKMLEEGTINASEAERLLKALGA